VIRHTLPSAATGSPPMVRLVTGFPAPAHGCPRMDVATFLSHVYFTPTEGSNTRGNVCWHHCCLSIS